MRLGSAEIFFSGNSKRDAQCRPKHGVNTQSCVAKAPRDDGREPVRHFVYTRQHLIHGNDRQDKHQYPISTAVGPP
jgi:hypothetical protein